MPRYGRSGPPGVSNCGCRSPIRCNTLSECHQHRARSAGQLRKRRFGFRRLRSHGTRYSGILRHERSLLRQTRRGHLMIALSFALTYTSWATLCFAMPSHASNLRTVIHSADRRHAAFCRDHCCVCNFAHDCTGMELAERDWSVVWHSGNRMPRAYRFACNKSEDCSCRFPGFLRQLSSSCSDKAAARQCLLMTQTDQSRPSEFDLGAHMSRGCIL